MKIFTITTLFFFLTFGVNAQELPQQAYKLYPTLSQMYGFAVGKYQDKILVLGGMIKNDVLEIYNKDFPNLEILLIDLGKNRATAFTSGNLEGLLSEQVAATGLAYFQRNHMLYLIGGYGYSETHHSYITFPYLTAIDLAATIPALLEGKNPVAHFYQICDERLALFDATLDFNGDEFFLINGKYAYKLDPFEENAYYHEEDRSGEAHTFKIINSGNSLNIKDFKSWYDVNDLRDYYGALLPESIQKEISRANQKKTHQ